MPLGVDSAIIGKALYARKFTLEEALDAVRLEAGQGRTADRA
jgi:phosphoribosylformimino-5-aminoimidazole carboxamide ribonucleotide (ProFAR) isomerase